MAVGASTDWTVNGAGVRKNLTFEWCDGGAAGFTFGGAVQEGEGCVGEAEMISLMLGCCGAGAARGRWGRPDGFRFVQGAKCEGFRARRSA